MKLKSKILIIAGSDSSGGAGIQADIKTVTSLGSYAMTAITAITSQNTTGVLSISKVPLSEIKNQIAPRSEGELRNEHVSEIATKLDVSENEVVSMNRRLAGKEHSLNAPIGEDGDQWQDWIVDKDMDQELKFAQQEEMDQRKDLLKDSIKVLNEREKEILYSRRLTDEPLTLEDLSKKYKISRERIRQIENKAFEKLQKHMLNLAKSKNLLPAT